MTSAPLPLSARRQTEGLMQYRKSTKIRFAHVDAAGIVFYPRYFEMLNAAIEDWFADVARTDFAQLHLSDGIGVPTVHINVDFHAASRLGDLIDIAVSVLSVGRTSATFQVEFTSGGEKRVTFTQVLVCIDLATVQSVQWPTAIHAALERSADVPSACP